MRDDIPTIHDKLFDELEGAQQDALETQELVEPTEDEKRNGWTAETLAAYHAERRAGQSVSIDPGSLHRRLARRPDEQNWRYDPHRWRG